MNIFWKTLSLCWVLVWILILFLSHETVCSFNNLLSEDFCSIFKGVKPKELSDYGDFFAGIFAPVAFLYLFLSYIHQNIISKRDYKLNKYSTLSPFYIQEMKEFLIKIKASGEFSENYQRILAVLDRKGKFSLDFYNYKKEFKDITDNSLDINLREKVYEKLILDWVWSVSCDLSQYREDIIFLIKDFKNYIMNYEAVDVLFSDLEGVENLQRLLLKSEFALEYEKLKEVIQNEEDINIVLDAKRRLLEFKNTSL